MGMIEPMLQSVFVKNTTIKFGYEQNTKYVYTSVIWQVIDPMFSNLWQC